jgi:hypothetical protein
MILMVHSDRSTEAFLILTKDEICAMMYAKEGTYAQDSHLSFLHALKRAVSVDIPAEHVLSSVEEDNPVGVKMTFTLGA